MAQLASAQVETVTVVLTSPPSPVGAGARATGVGSAFIAIADDATAASWNPAGLSQLERPEVSVVGLATHQVDDVGTVMGSTDTIATVVDVGTDSISTIGLNYLSAALPFAWRGRNMVVSLNYQQMLSFDRDFDFDRTSTFTGKPQSDRTVIDSEQRGSVYAFSPAIAVEITPEFSLGGTFNYWFDGIGRSHAWQRRATANFEIGTPEGIVFAEGSDIQTFENFRGVNGTFGLLWRMASDWTLGSFVELPFKAEFQFERGKRNERGSTDTLSMQLPLAFGFGLSWRPSDVLVLSTDVTRVQWSDFRISNSIGQKFLVSGDSVESHSVSDVTTVRIGTEYLVPTTSVLLAFRAGAFWDPEPSRGDPEDFWGGSLGFGATFDDFSVDAAYALRFGLGVSGTSTLNSLFQTPEDELDIFQHSFYLSTVYYF